MTTPETSPEACADSILSDMGASFATGAVGGSMYHFVKGLKNSPPGGRLAGSLQAIRMNVPSIALRFGVWGGILSACGCAMVYFQNKEDPWNSLITAAGGLLSTREEASPTPPPSLPAPPQISEPSSQSSSGFGGPFGKKPE